MSADLNVPDGPALESSSSSPNAAAGQVLSAGTFGRNDWTLNQATLSPGFNTRENDSIDVRSQGGDGQMGLFDEKVGEERIESGQLDAQVDGKAGENNLETGNVLDNLPPEAWEPCYWCRNESGGADFRFSAEDATCPGLAPNADGQPYRESCYSLVTA